MVPDYLHLVPDAAGGYPVYLKTTCINEATAMTAVFSLLETVGFALTRSGLGVYVFLLIPIC